MKNYLELTLKEKHGLAEFLNRNNEEQVTLEEWDKQLVSEVYGYGKGILITFVEGKVAGKISVVLKECIPKGTAYVLDLEISEEITDKALLARALLDAVKTVAIEHGAREVYLGASKKEILEILKSLHFVKQYEAQKLILEDREPRSTPLELLPLREENKADYLDLYNAAFGEVPNGDTLREKDVEECLRHADENRAYYMVTDGMQNIGFLQFDLKNDRGKFDLGLLKKFRGMGYGKRLLETAIGYLNQREAEVSLLVITKNETAYQLYKARGFRLDRVISEWFIL